MEQKTVFGRFSVKKLVLRKFTTVLGRRSQDKKTGQNNKISMDPTTKPMDEEVVGPSAIENALLKYHAHDVQDKLIPPPRKLSPTAPAPVAVAARAAVAAEAPAPVADAAAEAPLPQPDFTVLDEKKEADDDDDINIVDEDSLPAVGTTETQKEPELFLGPWDYVCGDNVLDEDTLQARRLAKEKKAARLAQREAAQKLEANKLEADKLEADKLEADKLEADTNKLEADKPISDAAEAEPKSPELAETEPNAHELALTELPADTPAAVVENTTDTGMALPAEATAAIQENPSGTVKQKTKVEILPSLGWTCGFFFSLPGTCNGQDDVAPDQQTAILSEVKDDNKAILSEVKDDNKAILPEGKDDNKDDGHVLECPPGDNPDVAPETDSPTKVNDNTNGESPGVDGPSGNQDVALKTT